MDLVVCNQCGGNMERREMVKDTDPNSPGFGKMFEMDWTLDIPICPVCRGVQGAAPVRRERDILGGFKWKRDPATGKKVPK